MLGGVRKGKDELGPALPEGMTIGGPSAVGTLSAIATDMPPPSVPWEPLGLCAGSLLVLLDRTESLALRPSGAILLP